MYTIGVEEEYMICDPKSGDLINKAYEEIDSIVEVGSGVGFKAHISLKVNPKLKYYLVETPPALYIAQKYLIANNHRVLTYEEIKSRNIKNIEDVNINDYKDDSND